MKNTSKRATWDHVFDIGKSDGLMDEPKQTAKEVEATYGRGMFIAYMAGYRAGVKEDGR